MGGAVCTRHTSDERDCRPDAVDDPSRDSEDDGEEQVNGQSDLDVPHGHLRFEGPTHLSVPEMIKHFIKTRKYCEHVLSAFLPLNKIVYYRQSPVNEYPSYRHPYLRTNFQKA